MTEAVMSEEFVERRGGKYLTFFLGEEEYGLEILKVQEIIGLMGITPVPRTPEFIRGVINLRGKVIPVIELRLKFGLVTVEETSETCIIVVQIEGISVGLVVDRVSEVTDILDEEVEDTPSFGADVDTDYILGIGKSGERVRMLLDIERVLEVEELVHLSQKETEAEFAS
ncbi:MAG: chemotaxis protein CheW [Gemmatimonadetes bacterium]|jgi:purine-binding chemotaxis protein CheW|nr:chemotaxis protein CheW [Gemmatimonadota bacterium]